MPVEESEFFAMEGRANIGLADLKDLPTYTAFGRAAQARLLQRGLRQYVPAAHDASAADIRAQVESGTLHVVRQDDEPVAFFNLQVSPSRWWPLDATPALYLSGMVVGPSARGRGTGGLILEWCAAQVARLRRQCLRLDCHADNPWLCSYYEAHGFKLRGRVEQHPGYVGCLYELVVPDRLPSLRNCEKLGHGEHERLAG
jgi:GNAT superfamily N-acetyltransferase